MSWTECCLLGSVGYGCHLKETGTVIHFNSNHPHEYKIAAFLYCINRIPTMPITENSKQNEWETIISIAKNNEFPISILTDLKTKIIKRKK
jgi:hypothetical protein